MPRGKNQKKQDESLKNRKDETEVANDTRNQPEERSRKAGKKQKMAVVKVKNASLDPRGRSKSNRKRRSAVKSKRGKKVAGKGKKEVVAAAKNEEDINDDKKEDKKNDKKDLTPRTKKAKTTKKSKRGFRSERARLAKPYVSRSHNTKPRKRSLSQAVYKHFISDHRKDPFVLDQPILSSPPDTDINPEEEKEVEKIDDRQNNDQNDESLDYTQFEMDENLDTPANSFLASPEPEKMKGAVDPGYLTYDDYCLRSRKDKEDVVIDMKHIPGPNGHGWHSGKGLAYQGIEKTDDYDTQMLVYGAINKCKPISKDQKREKRRQDQEEKQAGKKKED